MAVKGSLLSMHLSEEGPTEVVTSFVLALANGMTLPLTKTSCTDDVHMRLQADKGDVCASGSAGVCGAVQRGEPLVQPASGAFLPSVCAQVQ